MLNSPTNKSEHGSIDKTIEIVADVEQTMLKLDKTGLPLSPQPSDDPADPLNWPLGLKVDMSSISPNYFI